jgi:hypothetical protein
VGVVAIKVGTGESTGVGDAGVSDEQELRDAKNNREKTINKNVLVRIESPK